MSQTPFPLSPSLWAATAAPPPDTQPLTQSAQADVLVVGGGYAGLSTALHLAEQGVRVVVLEAREIGFGGSGRNGGGRSFRASSTIPMRWSRCSAGSAVNAWCASPAPPPIRCST